MANKAQYISQQANDLGEDFMNPADAIKPVLDKLGKLKFDNDNSKKLFIERIEQKYGKEVADTVRQYAGSSSSSYPTSMDTALKTVVDNINGILGLNPNV